MIIKCRFKKCCFYEYLYFKIWKSQLEALYEHRLKIVPIVTCTRMISRRPITILSLLSLWRSGVVLHYNILIICYLHRYILGVNSSEVFRSEKVIFLLFSPLELDVVLNLNPISQVWFFTKMCYKTESVVLKKKNFNIY